MGAGVEAKRVADAAEARALEIVRKGMGIVAGGVLAGLAWVCIGLAGAFYLLDIQGWQRWQLFAVGALVVLALSWLARYNALKTRH